MGKVTDMGTVSNPGEDISRYNAWRRGLNDGCGVADLVADSPPNQVPGPQRSLQRGV
jgi:hypothetical protein